MPEAQAGLFLECNWDAERAREPGGYQALWRLRAKHLAAATLSIAIGRRIRLAQRLLDRIALASQSIIRWWN